jgi:tetratricopeptide (TPR) repeat protein
MGQSRIHLQEQITQAAQSELSGRLAEALIHLTQAMESSPEAETLVPARARLLRQLRRHEEANQLIEALLNRLRSQCQVCWVSPKASTCKRILPGP